MSVIYRKTAKGLAEIETREFDLSPRPRQALILVNGRRTEADLSRLTLADASTLAELLAGGFIEVVFTVADRSLEPSAAPHSPVASMNEIQREAARYLIDRLGPTAEGLAIKLERAKSLPELQPLLADTARTLRSVGHSTLADEFDARFMTPLQG